MLRLRANWGGEGYVDRQDRVLHQKIDVDARSDGDPPRTFFSLLRRRLNHFPGSASASIRSIATVIGKAADANTFPIQEG
jgi:hypothetical protein